MNEEQARQMRPDRPLSSLGKALLTSKVAQVCEIGVVFLPGIAVVVLGLTLFGENPGAHQMAVSLAILLMIFYIRLGLKMRGQSWHHFGLTFRLGARRRILRAVAQSFVVAISSVALGLAHYSWGVTGAEQAGFMKLALGVSYLSSGRKL
ncbi:MAG: hypothetical protein IIB57_03830 [Planctomycetes bacterium]|nr:hypothetical protein [Planctomycetota bacterium]